MELRPVSPAPAAPVNPAVETKRAQLQAVLLQKTLQAQQDHVAEVVRKTSGKGQRLDIRV